MLPFSLDGADGADDGSDREPDREARSAALDHVIEALAEGCLDGLDARCLVDAALTTAFRELVATRGEEEVARYAADLPDLIRAGHFSAASRH